MGRDGFQVGSFGGVRGWEEGGEVFYEEGADGVYGEGVRWVLVRELRGGLFRV